MLNGTFADAAFKLAKEAWSTVDKRKGKMTGPIKTSFGYHLILVEDKKA